MKIPAVTFLALTIGFATSCANNEETERPYGKDPIESTLVGQVLLPGGFARRGIELHATVATSGGEQTDSWVPFNEEGHFSHTFEGSLISVAVTAGVSAEVFRLSGEELSELSQTSDFDLGVIDLRSRLNRHHLLVQAGEGKASGEIRVAMWFGLPPVGPGGGSVSLGSRQFPTVAIGQKQEWLVPLEAHSIYFLVERPAESGQKGEWRSGIQKLFGPFNSSDLPTGLEMD